MVFSNLNCSSNSRPKFVSWRSGSKLVTLPEYSTFKDGALEALELLLEATKNLAKCSVDKRGSNPDSPSSGLSPQRFRYLKRFKCQQYIKEIDMAKKDAERILLEMYALRSGENISIPRIPDKDRILVNEALSAGFDQEYIELLIKEFPRACEAGGIVDHINHPIHIACSQNLRAVRTILETHPEASLQIDEFGTLPLQNFLENEDINPVSDEISKEELKQTVNLFSSIDINSARVIFSKGVSLTLSSNRDLRSNRSLLGKDLTRTVATMTSFESRNFSVMSPSTH